MADNLNQSVLHKARLDKFILSFTVPECLKSTADHQERGSHHHSRNRVMPDKLQYSVYGVVVPEISIPSVELPYSGQHMKISGHVRDAYADVTVNFNVDNQYNNYWYVWRWLDVLNDYRESTYDDLGLGTSKPVSQFPNDDQRSRNRTQDPDIAQDYQTDMTVYGVNEYNKNTVQFTYTKAFPISLGEISYNYQDSGEVTSSLTFSFSQLLVNLL